MQSLLMFLIFLPFLGLVAVANLAERKPWARYVTYGSLAAINLGLLGLVFLALVSELVTRMSPELVLAQGTEVNWLPFAAICLATSALGFVPLVPAVRRWLARRLPIDPRSAVHTTALAFAVYEVGLNLAQMALIGDLENIVEQGLTLTLWDVLLSGLPLILFALLGVGLFLRRRVSQALERLGLLRPTVKQVLLAVAVTALLLGFDYGVNLAWAALDPAGYEAFEQVTDQLYSGLITVGGAIVLGLSAGISEELLFRGAVQPRLGLIITSVLFALGHIQYGMTVATLEVFIIGLVLGVMRNRASTTICILVHAGYNATGVLLGLLNP